MNLTMHTIEGMKCKDCNKKPERLLIIRGFLFRASFVPFCHNHYLKFMKEKW